MKSITYSKIKKICRFLDPEVEGLSNCSNRDTCRFSSSAHHSDNFFHYSVEERRRFFWGYCDKKSDCPVLKSLRKV